VERESATRSRLLLLRRRIATARTGLRLLEGKRQALMHALYEVAARALPSRDRLLEAAGRAGAALQDALCVEGREAIRSAGMAARRTVDVAVEERNVWGTRYPDLRVAGLRRAADRRGFDPVSASAFVSRCADGFEGLAEAFVEAVRGEVLLRRLGDEIRRVTRRVNGLRERVLPALRAELERVRGVLDEREREDRFRLKRMKRRRGGGSGDMSDGSDLAR